MSGNPVRVAVGVIRNSLGEVLIARRPVDKHQGGLWEFPGGKIEAGETCGQALIRELEEELGIEVLHSKPLIKVPFSYADKSVLLEVREVTAFSGSPSGREGQPLLWVSPAQLNEFSFPAANRPIIKALTLPNLLAITGPFQDEAQFVEGLKKALSRGAGMIQIRPSAGAASQTQRLLDLTRSLTSIPVTVNSAADRSLWSELPGLHLRSKDLMSITSRPVSHDVWLGASCHNLQELEQAHRIQADYACLSPVLETGSHPEAEALGWESFAELLRSAELPVYALGGLCLQDLDQAKACGAVGMAGIEMFWR
jgi:8-oxo-dGTP diphosphatase